MRKTQLLLFRTILILTLSNISKQQRALIFQKFEKKNAALKIYILSLILLINQYSLETRTLLSFSVLLLSS